MHVNYRACEWLKGAFFPDGPPFGKLHLDTEANAELFSKTHLQGVTLVNTREDEAYATQQHPETYNAAYHRLCSLARHLRTHYKTNQVKTAHLVVTHGIHVKAFAEFAYNNTRQEPNCQIVNKANYTGIAAANVVGTSISIRKGGQSAHLRDEAAEKFLFQQMIKEGASDDQTKVLSATSQYKDHDHISSSIQKL